MRPRGSSVQELWDGYLLDMHDRAIVENMPFTWRALAPTFGRMSAEQITIEDCRAYAKARAEAGIKPGTISTELGRLRMVLMWAEKHGYITKAPAIDRPSAPRRKDRHLTREQCRALIDAAAMPHIRLYTVLALGTGARNTALLELTWDRCDLDGGMIDLRNPAIQRPHKGRAIVPMNRTVKAALLEARGAALTDRVVEWAGRPVKSVKRALKAAANAAGVSSISPHLLRHSAAVHMAEAGISIEEIAQFLGHEDVNVTRRIYARFSPTYLRKAAAVLEYDDIGAADRRLQAQAQRASNKLRLEK